MAEHGAVGEAVGTLALVDHHVHQPLGSDLPRAAFEEQITESDRPENARRVYRLPEP